MRAMKFTNIRILALLGAIVLAASGHALAAPVVGSPAILVPAYFYPTFEPGNPWSRLNEAASAVQISAIVNPNNGRFETVDTNYATVADNLRAAGGKVFGYVQSNYGNLRAEVLDSNGNVAVQGFSFAMAKHDVDQYLSLYHVDGFFIDEMSALNAKVPEYVDLYNYIKGKNSSLVVIGNTGVGGVEASLAQPAADILLNYEDYGSNYAATMPPAWTQNYPTSSFANLAHSVAAEADMQAIVAGLAAHHAGYVYVTDRQFSTGNPWDGLPGYWTQEVAAVAALSAVPEPATGLLAGLGLVLVALSSRRGKPVSMALVSSLART